MTKKFKRTISFILTIALLITITYTQAPITVFGEENIDQGKCGTKASYIIDSQGTLTISGSGEVTSHNWTDYNEEIKKIVIEYGITSLPTMAFYQVKNATDVVMPDSIKVIPPEAFQDCVSLSNVTFPKKLNKICRSAFWNCNTLTKVKLPDSLESIEKKAFGMCLNLDEIEMSSNIRSVETEAFTSTKFYDDGDNWDENGILYCGNVLIKERYGVEDLEIKEGTRVIADRAFAFNDILTKVTIPDTISVIGGASFISCSKLKTVIVKGGLKEIDGSAFANDALLREVQLPETVTSIGGGAFSGCRRLRDFKTPDSTTKLGEQAFKDCDSLEKFTITKNVAIIGEECFDGCKQLLELTSYTEATPGSYRGYGELTLPESLEKIGAVEGSKYEKYANEKGIEFVKVNDWQTYNGENEYGKYLVTKGQKDYYKNYNHGQTDYIDYANLSINKNLKVVDSNAGYGDKESLFDGDVSSLWQMTYNIGETYINIDLGKIITFDQIKMWFSGTGLEYEVSVSTDKVNYETVMYLTNPCSGKRTDEIFLNKNVTARYVQFKTLYKHDTVDIFYEIGVYGEKGQIEYTEDPTTDGTTTVETSTVAPTTNKSTTAAPTTETTTQGLVETTTNEVVTTTKANEVTTTTHKDETSTTQATGETTPGSQTTSGQNETTSTKATDKQETTGSDKIKLTAPKIKELKEKNYHSAEIKWSKSGDKCSYIVYRSTNAKKNYKKIGTTSNLQYTDKTVKAGTTYFYKIKAICGNVESQSTVKKISIKGRPLKPRLTLKMTQKAIKIKWGIIKDNSKGIQVYVKSTSGGYKKYTKIYATTNLKHSSKKKGATGIESSKKGLKKGSTYQFKIRTYAIVNKKKVYSLWSNVKKIKIK